MSLACWECKRRGAFNTLVIFDPDGKFDSDKHVSSYRNFYTCCASFENFTKAKKSRFMVVQEQDYQDKWNTCTDGERLETTKYKLVDEDELRRKLPKTFERLAQKR